MGEISDLEPVERSERRGLLPSTASSAATSATSKKKPRRSMRRKRQDARLHQLLKAERVVGAERQRDLWMRPYWLGLGLFLVLLAFWLLDTLKDPLFGALLGGKHNNNALADHQPTAKLFSVFTTLVLVCFLEYLQQEKRAERRHNAASEQVVVRSAEHVLDEGGTWSRMAVVGSSHYNEYDDDASSVATATPDDCVSARMFVTIGVPYCVFFGMVAYLLQFNPATALTDSAGSSSSERTDNSASQQFWLLLGYCWYAAIESFGSLMVAVFWSYTNSTLSLSDAEAYYGTIIACAQMGAISGSTMVTLHVWNAITLVVTACLVILLHILVMTTYSRRFSSSSISSSAGSIVDKQQHEPLVLSGSGATTAATAAEAESTLLSGVHLILKHNYVLLILGVSCLYEVSLTCMNYQMTLLGWHRFEESPTFDESMSFTQFMGHYGQMVNISSLVLSSIVFPFLIHRVGLKYTLRLFPTLLLLANVVAFGAFPGNLGVLFLSMSLLKAMTYSIHDPAKEILYIPTSNAIKFKAKFWIDVVGARFAKAVGSSINHYSGDVPSSIRVASTPSLVTAAALWYVCYRIGSQFEELVESDTTVGLDDDDNDPHRINQEYSAEHEDDGDGRGVVEESNEAMELTAL